jgi:pimeloyl-ACP methyl ester carboxylesterase
MNRRFLIAIGAAGSLGAFLLGRRAALKEDLRWEDVAKPGRVVDIDGYGVHVVEAGAGPAVVLVHGFGGHTYHYRKLAPILARGHRVIAVDLKGFGYSERDASTGLSHAAQVEMLVRLLDRLDVERAVFVGHSMGGAVVQRFAATYPHMADALVLAASVGGDERFSRRAMPPRLLMRPVLPVLGAFAASRLLKASFYDASYLTPEVRDEYMRPARLKGSMDGLMSMIQQASQDREIDYRLITMPVLLLNGAHDPVVPLSTAQRLRGRIPQARLVVIERAAHALIDERAEECARAIEDFLRDARTESTAAAPSQVSAPRPA